MKAFITLMLIMLASTALGHKLRNSAEVNVETDQSSFLVKVYRFYNAGAGSHYMTTDPTAGGGQGLTYQGQPFCVLSKQLTGSLPFYVLYNFGSGDFVYTTSPGVKDNLIGAGYQFSGNMGFVFPKSTVITVTLGTQQTKTPTVPLYQFYSYSLGDHLYTTNQAEGQNMSGYVTDGVAGYVVQSC